MRWSNLLLIFRREVLDQIRDRRTLFMIFVLPILLYPLIGYGIIQFSAALEQKPRVVLVVGAEHLPAEPPLLNPERNGFDPGLFDSPAEAGRLVVELAPSGSDLAEAAGRKAAVRQGLAAAVLVIPPDVARQIREKGEAEIPIDYNSVDEASQFTYLRVKEVLSRWKRQIVTARLTQDRLPESYTEPIQIRPVDVATEQELGGSVWGRLFPFLLVIMSLTGAFYPAVDLCAGEKERGTMETLLISPASRSEIVLGKFLTVMLASITTALLNLVSMGLTGLQMAQRATGLGMDASRRAVVELAPPTLTSVFWIIVLLIPLAAFFSAVCLSLAVLARSMKEGQYYMTPLYLICLPLIFLTLAPGIELNLFYSLVPITGVALLLRAFILGDYATAAQYFLPVLVPTVVYAAVALRWAIDQFQREDVLFREAERVGLRIWIRHLIRDRQPRPTGAQATLCFALILTASWFLLQYMAMTGLETALPTVAAGQFLILLPPLIMAVMLTSSPRQTLRLNWPHSRYLVLAVGFVIALNPLVNELRQVVERLFPIPSVIQESFAQLMSQAPSFWVSLGVFALLPAVCEEVAFRGFILSGLEHQRRTRSAIFLSALMFGFLHVLLSLFQQLFNAALLGIVLGLLAVRSRSILPGMLFHFLNNALAISLAGVVPRLEAAGLARWIYRNPAEGLYHEVLVVLSLVVSGFLFYYLWKLDRPRRRSALPA